MQDKLDVKTQEDPRVSVDQSVNGEPVWIDPDLDFIQSLSRRGGDLFKKCMQCGTCSSACAISPDAKPFPSKEMAWATWGMKDRLLRDPDVWLCHQCTDCSTRCPRGARPGDVLAAVRQESVAYHAFPHFLGRWLSQPQFVPILLGIPTALLVLALYLKTPLENLFGITHPAGQRIVYSYSAMFPHWLLNSFFILISILVLLAVIVGVKRFWNTLKKADPHIDATNSAKSLFPSIITTLKKIITHKNFATCTSGRSRYLSHMSVFFGFMALSAVTFWVITSGLNPLLQKNFVYPFGFWSPWKILANIGGLSLIFGLILMIRDRFKDNDKTSQGSFFDWTLLSTLLLVVLTGFFTEALHYVRLEPHRHLIYFIHLVFACALIMYLPYSKFAHIVYRTVALIYAEYSGRNEDTSSEEASEKQ
ncbi:MAG: heterodisulfide reductase subunit E [candidate division Zixibacteria bacterium]|nr:heterodisulfide reductase subunit E [candidate division Zixibacteria bacterium]